MTSVHKMGPRRGKPRRNRNTREPVCRVLVVCEGKKTEKLYLSNFVESKIKKSVDIIAEGKNAPAVFKRALGELKNGRTKGIPYDKAWIVFDKDELSDDQVREIFLEAKKYAKKKPKRKAIKVAYSNESFELWLLLHYGYYDMSLNRYDYEVKLSEKLGRPYNKSDKEIMSEISQKVDIATENADSLLSKLQVDPDNPDISVNPTTTVHKLVRELQDISLRAAKKR